jgi:hypothetical protein
MKEGPCGHGRLMVARRTFLQGSGPVGSLNGPIFGALTFRTDKPLRPTLLEQIFLACEVSPKASCHSSNVIRHPPLHTLIMPK